MQSVAEEPVLKIGSFSEAKKWKSLNYKVRCSGDAELKLGATSPILEVRCMTEDFVICKGTLMRKDIPIGEVYVDERDVVQFTAFTEDKTLYPFEMKYARHGTGFREFLEERVTPKSRYGIAEDLRKAGFERYSIAAILLASNGRDCSDPFWIRFETGPQTWKEVWEAVGVYNRV